MGMEEKDKIFWDLNNDEIISKAREFMGNYLDLGHGYVENKYETNVIVAKKEMVLIFDKLFSSKFHFRSIGQGYCLTFGPETFSLANKRDGDNYRNYF